jgi:sortase A
MMEAWPRLGIAISGPDLWRRRVSSERAQSRPASWSRAPAAEGVPRPSGPAAPSTPGLDLLRSALIVLSVLASSLVLHLVGISRLQHSSSQQRAYNTLRTTVAEGTTPTGPTDERGRPLRGGTPVAYLEIPAIGVREVVGEGTSAADLMQGPGHRRDSPLPGQVGTSVVLGRQASYGGPFRRLGELDPGDNITVTTGLGVSRFTVRSLRSGGEPTPPPLQPGQGRLLLVSGAGSPYVPSGVLRVDADLVTSAQPASPPSVTAATLSAPERIMATDTSTAWRLVLWLQVLIGLAVGIVWAWQRWGRPQAWITFFPPTALAGILTASEAARFLPNLL